MQYLHELHVSKFINVYLKATLPLPATILNNNKTYRSYLPCGDLVIVNIAVNQYNSIWTYLVFYWMPM